MDAVVLGRAEYGPALLFHDTIDAGLAHEARDDELREPVHVHILLERRGVALVARIIYTFGAPQEPRQRLDLGLSLIHI